MLNELTPINARCTYTIGDLVNVFSGLMDVMQLPHLVISDVDVKIFVTLGIQIVRQYGAAFFRSGQSKRADASEHVRD